MVDIKMITGSLLWTINLSYMKYETLLAVRLYGKGKGVTVSN
jgi:hypothetical protein